MEEQQIIYLLLIMVLVEVGVELLVALGLLFVSSPFVEDLPQDTETERGDRR